MSGRSKGAAAASSSSASAKKTRAEILGSAHSSSAAGGRKRKKRYEGTAFDGGFNQDEEDEDRAHPVFTEPVNMHDNMNKFCVTSCKTLCMTSYRDYRTSWNCSMTTRSKTKSMTS